MSDSAAKTQPHADQSLFDIEVCKTTQRVTLLTDRWGEVEAFLNDKSQKWDAFGITYNEIVEISEGLDAVWRDETSYLVHDTSDNGIKIMIVSSLSQENLPTVSLDMKLGSDDMPGWRRALTLHAPQIEHLARGVSHLDDPDAREIEILIDTSVESGAAICALIPVDADGLYEPIASLLFDNGLAFPPSAHAQISAASALRWRYDPENTPADALPGSSRPI
ncbi:hypothetical protein ACOI1H_16240 [Loktanella sp. DJP18]|uniref:hypothetical protein n=1 Tax=Loktanella sp. DJP18 TaxID=3409788 RepID=UPI003BB673A2